MKNIEEGEKDSENEDRAESNKDKISNEVLLGNKKVLSTNKKNDGLINDYKEKNKFRRNFHQKQPLNK